MAFVRRHPAPFAGLFNIVGRWCWSSSNRTSSPARQGFTALPGNLQPPVPTTNRRPATATRSTPRHRRPRWPLRRPTWDGSPTAASRAAGTRPGELTPIQRYADMFFGTGLPGLDGTAWYHPRRLTIDAGAVAAGNANPAQDVLNVQATHGDDLPRTLRIYAFGASLGGSRVLDSARNLARQSDIPRSRLTLVEPRVDLLAQRSQLGQSRGTTSCASWCPGSARWRRVGRGPPARARRGEHPGSPRRDDFLWVARSIE